MPSVLPSLRDAGLSVAEDKQLEVKGVLPSVPGSALPNSKSPERQPTPLPPPITHYLDSTPEEEFPSPDPNLRLLGYKLGPRVGRRRHVLEEPGIVRLRRFSDVAQVRRLIYEKTLEKLRQIEPVSNSLYTLSLKNIDYSGDEDFPLAEQKKAILEGRSLFRRLRGDLVLSDAQGNPISTKRVTIARVPYYTPRGTFIIRGVEYTLSNQMRLRPGVYARSKSTGELEAHVNLLFDEGPAHRIIMDPEKGGLFRIQLGQANIPLYPVLKAFGITDAQMQEAWGKEVYANNVKRYGEDSRSLQKFLEKVLRRKVPASQQSEALQEIFSLMKHWRLDPIVTSRTMGQPYDSVSPDLWLKASQKLLHINQGKAQPDDRDHLAYQVFMGPEDLISERVRLAPGALKALLWKATYKRNLDSVPPNFLDKALYSAIMGSGLGNPGEEVNPSEILDQLTRSSRMGEGGIPSTESIPDEARAVHPSQLGFIDIVRAPESMKVGVDSRLAWSALKGSDGRIYAPFIDARTKKKVYVTPQDLFDKVIAFPGEMETPYKYVAAIHKNEIGYFPRNKVDYYLPHMEHAFNPLANVVPIKSAVKGQRVAMGSRMYTQALPLVKPEAPLVQSALPGQEDYRSFEEEFGDMMGVVRSDTEGTVTRVTPDFIEVRTPSGTKRFELHNHFPYNRKTFLHNEPAVKVGQTIKKGDILARSNYTDKDGRMAIGLNLYTAYLPYKGYNFEDAVVISASAAKKLTSEHIYQHQLERIPNLKTKKREFISLFPSEYSRELLDKLDDDGVIKPGVVVQPGDPLLLGAGFENAAHNRMTKAGGYWRNLSVTWDHSMPGVVVDVAKTSKGSLVTVKTYRPAQVGDKLTGRYGDKGVIAAIIPDDHMPRDLQGRPFEILLNPLGIITRTNPAQVIEAALGKLAAKLGRPIKIEDFKNNRSLVDHVLSLLKKHGLSDTEDIIDPQTGLKIPNILTGHRFIMKLHHMAEDKGQARSSGGGYTSDEQPAKGDEGQSKRFAMMEITAMLSHGGIENLRDVGLIRGQKNHDWWALYLSGYNPPPPRTPLVYRKFLEFLRGSGINPLRQGDQIRLVPLANSHIKELVGNRILKNADLVEWSGDMKPVDGGLFDKSLTGGHYGNLYSGIKLAEPLPNPALETSIRRLLNLTERQYLDILSGRATLGGKSGGEAIRSALSQINVDQAIRSLEQAIQEEKGSKRDDLIKKLAILKGVKRSGIHPKEWVWDIVPVIPPIFRPVSLMSNRKSQVVADANFLYKDLFDLNESLSELKKASDDVSEERLSLYKALKAIAGLGDPVVQSTGSRTEVKGLLRHVFGESPKFGMVQRKILSKTVDLVGRAVITPDPNLSMDEVAIPEEKAWEIYKPFVVRRLVREGVPPYRALDIIEKKDALARKALNREMQVRPVLISRAPVWHRYGVMAFWPRLTRSEVMKVSPLIIKGFNADFDGDQMNYHVPASDEAVTEAIERLMPSKNLIFVRDFRVHQLPVNELAGGLYLATYKKSAKDRPEKVFRTVSDAWKALRRGEIRPDDPVVILEIQRQGQ